jgi:nicotinamide-nucleotide amidase
LQAAGVQNPQGKAVIIAMPGVPTEMKVMWEITAKPFLQKAYGQSAIFSCELKHYGISESALAEKFAQLLDYTNPTVAPLAGSGECRLRITAKAKTIEEAEKLARPVIEKIKTESGVLCYGINHDRLETAVARLLTQQNKTLSIAESCTGGLVSKRMTDIPGSSKYTMFNLVTYSNEAKNRLLGVHDYILQTKGAVSLECAHAMASGIRKLSQADIGLSITGLAGPDGGTKEKPVGLVYIALSSEHEQMDETLHLPEDMSRNEIRERTANRAINLVRLFLLKAQPKLVG